jgi:tetratricopeptide (TPR) repeat protein
MSEIEILLKKFDDFLRVRSFSQCEKVLAEILNRYGDYPTAIQAVDKKRATIHLARARDAVDSVNSLAAQREISLALETDPNLLEAHLLAADLFVNRPSEQETALNHLRKAIELGEAQLDKDKLIQLKYRLAEILYEREDYENALPLYSEVKENALAKFPKSVDREIDCLSQLGDTLLKKSGSIDEAIAKYVDAIERNPNHPRIKNIRRRLGEMYLAMEPAQPEKALEQFQALQSEQSIPELFYLIAKCYIAQGRDEQAIDALEKEIALNKSNYNAHIDLSDLYMERKQFSKADDILDKAQLAQPEAIEAFLRIGRLRRLQERYPEAKKALNTVLRKDSENRDALLALGLVLLEEEDRDSAASYFDRVIDMFRQLDREGRITSRDRNSYAQAWNGRGRVDLERNQVRLSLNRFDRALNIAPQLSETYYYVGEGKRQLGDFKSAETAYQKAIELDPDNPDYYLAVGILYQNNLNSPDKAIASYNAYFDNGGLDFSQVNRWLEELGAETREITSNEAGS